MAELRPSRRALVFGASGYVGRHLVPRLVAAGYRVRAAARDPDALAAHNWSGVECVRSDALKAESLPAVLRGIDVAYYLVHSMAAGPDFGALDVRAATNFRAAAAAARVGRIIYLGGLVPQNPVSEHLRSRFETGECLRGGSVPVTELRAAMIVGPGSAAFEVMRDLVNYLPVMVTPRWVDSKSPPIALGDLLTYLLRLAEIEAAAGQVYDAGGPELVTYAEQMHRLGALVGKRPRIVPVPLLTPRLSSYWLGLITSVPVNIARALIDGLQHDVVADDAPLRHLVQIPLQSLDAAFQSALYTARRHDVPASWGVDDALQGVLRPEYSFHALRASGEFRTPAVEASIWRELIRFGEGYDFFALNPLWWIRGALDRLVGGPSFRRPRPAGESLRVGDTVDAWRVVAVEPRRRLLLLLEMRVPGCGLLELECLSADETGAQRIVRATAHWYPAGVLGLLYWHPLYPFHRVIFKRMTREIARRALPSGGNKDLKAEPE